jgi:hypothetical protein
MAALHGGAESRCILLQGSVSTLHLQRSYSLLSKQIRRPAGSAVRPRDCIAWWCGITMCTSQGFVSMLHRQRSCFFLPKQIHHRLLHRHHNYNIIIIIITKAAECASRSWKLISCRLTFGLLVVYDTGEGRKKETIAAYPPCSRTTKAYRS